MIITRTPLLNNLTALLSFQYKTTRRLTSFSHRIKINNKRLDRVDRQFHMRPPNLSQKEITFPIKMPFRLRHRYNPKKIDNFVDNSSKIHWNRLTPN